MLQAEIITIGDELLIGQVIDTNSAWIGEQLNLMGIKVKQITSISDEREAILKSLTEATKRADIILITGGLGPTKDDITKTTLCEYFNCGYRFDTEVYEHIVRIFAKFGRTVSDINRKQAELPEKCIKLHNANGTAPGMWFEENGKIYISMPGVPFEMKGIVVDELFPRIKKRFKMGAIYHKTILTIGIGESYLSEMIEGWENSLPINMKLAYLPSPGFVRLRISGNGKNINSLKAAVDFESAKLEALISNYIFGYENDTLPLIISELLVKKKKTLSTAESCTGGNIAAQIVSIPGSSAYFIGGIVSYSNEIKQKELGVNPKTLEEFGAVSSETVVEMAFGALSKFETDYSIAVSGIAGPDGGTEDKPVGTLWVAIGKRNGTVSTQKFLLGHNRERNIQIATLYALNKLRIKLINETD